MRVVRIILIVGIVPLLAFLTAWGTLALWYRLPPDGLARIAITAGFALFGLIATLSQFGANWRRRLVAFAVVFALLAAWWTTIKPPATGNWAPEVARQVTGTIDGDILTLTDMRAFDWRSPTEATETWTTRSFDLGRITSTGMVLSYWGNPDMAHFMLTFGFADGRYLTWSIEVRRRIGGEFSPVADFFKSNTLVIVAADDILTPPHLSARIAEHIPDASLAVLEYGAHRFTHVAAGSFNARVLQFLDDTAAGSGTHAR